jgi:hypothetical protein
MHDNPRTIFLTGATGLLGFELTKEFLARGHTVLAGSRNAASIAAMREKLPDLPGVLEPVEVDLMSFDAAELAKDLSARGLAPDYLINNARNVANLRMQANGWPNAECWHAEFELGVVASTNLTIAFSEMTKSRLRSVVNVGSIYGVVAMNQRLYDSPALQAPPHYGVVKAALVHATKELAIRLAPKGIRVNAISYGGIEGRADAAFRARYGDFAPNGRMLRRDELFSPVEFLLCSAPESLTGHNLIVDGGWTLW